MPAPSMEIRVQTALLGRLLFDTMDLVPLASGYRLRTKLVVQFEAEREDARCALIDAIAEISIWNQQGAAELLGTMRTSHNFLPLAPLKTTRTTSLDLQVDLPTDAIEAIEVARDGGNPSFALALCAHLRAPTPDDRQSAVLYCEVEQSRWTWVLAASGFARTLVLEVVAPRAADSTALSTVFELLERARRHHFDGDYIDAVGACRDVLKSLAGSTDKDDATEAEKPPKKRSKIERYADVQRALLRIVSLAHHAGEVGVDAAWNRADSVAVMAMTTALVSRAAAK